MKEKFYKKLLILLQLNFIFHFKQIPNYIWLWILCKYLYDKGKEVNYFLI